MIDVSFWDVVSTTRSMRRLASTPVSDDLLEKLVEAATLGPSGGNAQPVRWLVVLDEGVRRELGDIYRRCSVDVFAPYRVLAAKEPPDPIARSVLHLVDHLGEAPAILVPCTRVAAASAQFFREPWSQPLLSVASSVWPCVQNLCLAARAEGLGATPTVIHNILEPEVKRVLELPDGVVAWSLIPVGYPLGPWGRPTRRPVADVAYRDTWGHAWGH